MNTRRCCGCYVGAAGVGEGSHVEDVLSSVLDAGAQHRRRVPTATLNMVVREATQWKAPPTQRNTSRKGRIYYATQAGLKPPSFVFFVNDEELFTDDYRRYVERQLRDNIGFPGTPLRLFWRGKPKREATRPPREASTPREPSTRPPRAPSMRPAADLPATSPAGASSGPGGRGGGRRGVPRGGGGGGRGGGRSGGGGRGAGRR
ncbi:GTPase Der [Tetrabaena socialis]|uniref:GTPase Der n=1 Tax=Tetrabaena socialis TaxID=47790 RepID=A0A2J7ZU65_9CHLO|nr:GTPase Der [Tetrabaena socialis]|eukprot:PNH03815.1 GTPase Der [Tetrabaena socialis]